MTEVKLVTLKTNHTLVGEVDCNDDNSITIKQPLQVVIQPGKDGTSGVMFVPFVEYSVEFKTGFKLSMEDILFISSPVKEIEDNYRQLFSRIQIASALPKM
jgi:hypothetical protein